MIYTDLFWKHLFPNIPQPCRLVLCMLWPSSSVTRILDSTGLVCVSRPNDYITKKMQKNSHSNDSSIVKSRCRQTTTQRRMENRPVYWCIQIYGFFFQELLVTSYSVYMLWMTAFLWIESSELVLCRVSPWQALGSSRANSSKYYYIFMNITGITGEITEDQNNHCGH